MCQILYLENLSYYIDTLWDISKKFTFLYQHSNNSLRNMRVHGLNNYNTIQYSFNTRKLQLTQPQLNYKYS